MFGRTTAWAGPYLGVPVPLAVSSFVVHWQVGRPAAIGGALLVSAGEFALYQHNQPVSESVPVVVMSLVVVWVCHWQ